MAQIGSRVNNGDGCEADMAGMRAHNSKWHMLADETDWWAAQTGRWERLVEGIVDSGDADGAG